MATTHLTSQAKLAGTGGSNSFTSEDRRDGFARAPFKEDLLKVIALIMVEDGHVTEEEIRIARRVYENMVDENLSRDELGRMCAYVQQQRLNTQSFLSTARDRRSLEEKLMLVQALFGVAGADGNISSRRMQALVKAQQVLGLDESEFQRAVDGTSQWLS